MTSYKFTAINKISGVTPIPNIFIHEYMPSADGNFVKVYLYGLMESLYGSIVPGDSLSKKLHLIESDIIKAWNFWESKGLVRFTKNDMDEITIEFLNVADSYIAYNRSASGEKYSPEFISLKLNDPKIKDMFETIEKLIARPMSPKEISMYLEWIDEYSFSPEVIMLLVEYCRSKNKMDSRYIEKVAMAWHDAGITSIDDAQKHIASYEERFNNYRVVLDFLGLKENDLMKPQEDFLDKWFGEWQFSLDMILEACKICSLRINEPNFSYIDGILSNWYKKGIKTLKDIAQGDDKKKSKNVKFKPPVNSFNSYTQRSYDVKDLEKRLLGIDEEEQNVQ